MGRENETSSCSISTAFVDHWDAEPPVNIRVHDALRKITAHRLQEQALQAIQDGQTQKGTASLRTAEQKLFRLRLDPVEVAGSLLPSKACKVILEALPTKLMRRVSQGRK